MKKIARVFSCLGSRKADLVINRDFKTVRVFYFHHRGATQIPVGVVTVAKGQAVHATVALVIDCSIIEEPTDTSTLVDRLISVCSMKFQGKTYSTAVVVNDQSETIELANRMNTGGADPSLTIFCIP